MDAATSKAVAEGAGGADKIAASCQRSQPGGTGTDGHLCTDIGETEAMTGGGSFEEFYTTTAA